jgi:hypothetical protein
MSWPACGPERLSSSGICTLLGRCSPLTSVYPRARHACMQAGVQCKPCMREHRGDALDLADTFSCVHVLDYLFYICLACPGGGGVLAAQRGLAPRAQRPDPGLRLRRGAVGAGGRLPHRHAQARSRRPCLPFLFPSFFLEKPSPTLRSWPSHWAEPLPASASCRTCPVRSLRNHDSL